jgi:DNA-binding PadR family transcriptional regulator
VSALESKTAYIFNRRVVQNFLDIIILKHLKNNSPISGYDVIKLLHKRFHMLPSPGTVYSLLYSLERQNLIEGTDNRGKRLYTLTCDGERLLNQICGAKNHIQAIITSIFSEAQKQVL